MVSAAYGLANTWVNSIVVRLRLCLHHHCLRRRRSRLFVWNIAINKNKDDDDDELRVYVYCGSMRDIRLFGLGFVCLRLPLKYLFD